MIYVTNVRKDEKDEPLTMPSLFDDENKTRDSEQPDPDAPLVAPTMRFDR